MRFYLALICIFLLPISLLSADDALDSLLEDLESSDQKEKKAKVKEEKMSDEEADLMDNLLSDIDGDEEEEEKEVKKVKKKRPKTKGTVVYKDGKILKYNSKARKWEQIGTYNAQYRKLQIEELGFEEQEVYKNHHEKLAKPGENRGPSL